MYAEVLYAMADRALTQGFRSTLEKQLTAVPPDAKSLREALQETIAEIAAEQPSRELVALALAKILVRNYEALHIEHLARVQDGQAFSK
jgi:hypothetical protein